MTGQGWTGALIAGFLCLAPAAAIAQAPSFDCAKAASWTERQVCSDPSLADLDRELAVVYGRARAAADAAGEDRIRTEQRAWAKDRGGCETGGQPRACLEHRYRDRLAQLQATLPSAAERPAWVDLVAQNLAAVDQCLGATPAAMATLTGMAQAAGRIEVDLESSTGRAYACAAPGDGKGLAAVQDAAAPAAPTAARFTRAPAAPGTADCRGSAPVMDGAGTVLGWISTPTC
jgi:uncharacterized protein